MRLPGWQHDREPFADETPAGVEVVFNRYLVGRVAEAVGDSGAVHRGHHGLKRFAVKFLAIYEEGELVVEQARAGWSAQISYSNQPARAEAGL